MNNIRNNYVNMVCLVLINSIIIIYPITLYFSDFVGKHAPAYYLGLLNHEIVFSATILLLSGLSLLINSNKKILNITKEKLYLFIMLAALVGWINLSSLWSLSAYMSAPEIGVWTSYLLWWILMLSLFEKNDCYIIIQIIMISIILSASVYISYFINDYYTPYFLLNINRSIVSECLLAISPFLLGYGLQKERLEGNLCVLLSFISLVAIILIGQRAPLYSMLAIMSLLVISVAIHWERMRKKILFFGASLIIMLSCIIMANPHKKSSDHWDTVSRTYNINQASETLDYRINGFLVCWYQWKDQWLFGTGQGTYQMSYPLYAHHLPLNEYARFSRRLENSQVSRAHCEPVQIAAELGIFGITLWLAIFIVYPIFLAYDSIKKKQIITLCGSAGIMGVAISSLASSFATRTILPGIIIMTVYYLSLNQMNDKKIVKICYYRLILVTLFILACINSLSLYERWMEMRNFNQIIEKFENKTSRVDAIQEYSNLIYKYPDNHIYYYFLGNLLANNGLMNKELSIHCWERATQLGLYSINTISALSYSYFISKRYADSYRVVDRGLAIYPDSYWLKSLKEVFYQIENNIDKPQNHDIQFLKKSILGKLSENDFSNYNGDFVSYLNLLIIFNKNTYPYKVTND